MAKNAPGVTLIWPIITFSVFLYLMYKENGKEESTNENQLMD